MWNDTEKPLAVFFTFRCYGTWLHGDERGSVDRRNNLRGMPRIEPNPAWEKYAKSLLNHDPVLLDADARASVGRSIVELCLKRSWYLHAANIRTNHGHAVIDIKGKPSERALIAIKANATRHLRADGVWMHEHSPWAEKGSRRNLWNEKSVWEACNYVLNEQGGDLNGFDWW